MCSGSSLCLLCIFPRGMLCLSACSMAFVSILLAVCTLSGVCMFVSVCSISWVKFVQFAFL